jgi:hypothetical protein
VVTAGLTVCVPPLGNKVYVLPSLPVTVTCVAFIAVTFNVDAPPALIEAGLAVMPTVGGGFGVTVTVALAEVFPPAPVAVAVYVVVAVGLTACVPPLGCKV